MIWKTHKFLKNRIPKHWIQFFKSFLEVNLNTFWMNKAFSSSAEDMVLKNLLIIRDRERGIDGLSNTGFYVDVGAFAPKQFSNTYYFYRQGWRGINIDASPGSMKVFKRARPRDINIEAAVSNKEITLDFYTWGTPTVVNTLSPDHAKEFTTILKKEPTIVRVKARTLQSILDEHLPVGKQIDFLSVDAEGHDLEVLQSNNWTKYRPFLVIVETATHSLDASLSHEVTKYMISQNYEIVAWVFPNIVFRDTTLHSAEQK